MLHASCYLTNGNCGERVPLLLVGVAIITSLFKDVPSGTQVINDNFAVSPFSFTLILLGETVILSVTV